MVLSAFTRTVAIAYRMIAGRKNMEKFSAVDWHQRLEDLSNPKDSYALLRDKDSKEAGYYNHLENLRLMAAAEPGTFPKPSEIYNALIMPAYNESIEVIEPALSSVLDDYEIGRASCRERV